jgi:hypothetical protein
MMNLTHTSSAPGTETVKKFLHSIHYDPRVNPHYQSSDKVPVGADKSPTSHGGSGRLTVIDRGSLEGDAGILA